MITVVIFLIIIGILFLIAIFKGMGAIAKDAQDELDFDHYENNSRYTVDDEDIKSWFE